jgi:energy-coupling factor transporter ATP-binding protein EcfA2
MPNRMRTSMRLLEEQARLEDMIQATDAHNLEHKLEVAADALRLPPWEADVSNLSGGELRRVALCRLLLSSPDMLLLDEPTNHLDAESVAWLERFLHEFPGTVVAITHDRYFLDNAAGWILELDRGRHSLRRQLLVLAGTEGSAPGAGEAPGSIAPEGDQVGAGVGAQQPQGPPGQEQGAPAALRAAEFAGVPGPQRNQRDLHPAGAASRGSRSSRCMA